MERYYKNIKGGYIASVSTGAGVEEITQEEYETILSLIHDCPDPEAGYSYKLRTDLTWELVEAPVVDEEEISAEEALEIILGGEV